MVKRKRRPYTPPPQGDPGPDTAAQRQGAVILEVIEGGQKWRRKRRDHILDIMARGTRRRPAMISRRQAAAGMELVDRFEATMTAPSPAWTRIFVDSSPRPGDVSVADLEAKARLAELTVLIPRHCKAVTYAICRDNHSIRPGFTNSPDRAQIWLKRLREALDILADHLRL